MTRPRTGRLVRMSTVVAGAALLLSGCGTYPGAAAVVGDTTIPDEQVDDWSAALCSAELARAGAQGQGRPDLATRGARQAALSLAIDAELSRQFARANQITVPDSELSSALAQNAQTLDALPADRREAFTELFRAYLESQLILSAAGRDQVGESGDPQQATAAGAQQRQQWLAEQGIEVEVDPRFGEFRDGGLAGSGGSLSIPVSEGAAAGANPEPGAEWAAGLPVTQKCG